jgi:hypothetical protein
MLIVSTKVFSQSDPKQRFDKIKSDIELNQINLKKVDLVNENLNET